VALAENESVPFGPEGFFVVLQNPPEEVTRISVALRLPPDDQNQPPSLREEHQRISFLRSTELLSMVMNPPTSVHI
jgi:hypothetical protein